MVIFLLRLDDPLDAVAVHMGGGVVGLLAQPFFAYNGEDYIILTDDGYKLFGFNFVGLLAIMAWSGAWSAAIFGSLKAVNLLRVDYHTEESGLDKTRHGEVAYPDWVKEQCV